MWIDGIGGKKRLMYVVASELLFHICVCVYSSSRLDPLQMTQLFFFYLFIFFSFIAHVVDLFALPLYSNSQYLSEDYWLGVKRARLEDALLSDIAVEAGSNVEIYLPKISM